MVASTDIKFYVHTNNNAPQLTNNFGCMIDVLDACLVNGFGAQSVSTLKATGKVVTVTFGAAHNLMQYQVIKITGANQSEFNGEHRILSVPNANSLTFELANTATVTQASGTIVCSLPPLGWEKPFSSTAASGTGGKAAYRSTNLLLPSRPFLRVVDELDPAYTATYAKYAKVGIVEDMTDIDTMLGVQAPYDAANPDKNWAGTGSGTSAINGWAKWYYARANPLANTTEAVVPTSGTRTWFIVGCGDYFYLLNNLNPQAEAKVVYGFGSFKSFLHTDTANNFLAATMYNNVPVSSTNNFSGVNSLTSEASVLNIQREYSLSAKSVSNAKVISLFATASGYTDSIASPSLSNQIPSAPIFINDGSLRGSLPLLNWIFQRTPYLDNTLITEGDNAFIAMRTLSTQYNVGQILMRIA